MTHFNHKQFAQDSINYLTEKDNVRDWAEAIAIATHNLRDKEDKMLRIKLSDDFEQEMEFCFQLAEMLLNKKRESNDLG
jgi:hypothetical protein